MPKQKRKSHELALTDWVERSNGLVDILRGFNLTLTQMDFVYLYLSKINASDSNTKTVVFTLDEYLRITEKEEVNEARIDEYIQDLLGKSYKAKLEEENKKGKEYIPLFSYFQFYKTDEGDWYISATCHEKSADLFFDLAEEIKYTKFQLWNVLGLKEQSYRRMYEILKQYERVKFLDITIEDLRKELWLGDKYETWQDLKAKVIEVCKKALVENTDIRFTWEMLKKKGKSPISLRFNIFPNKPTERKYFQEVIEDCFRDETTPKMKILEKKADEDIRQNSENVQANLKKFVSNSAAEFPDAIEVEYEEVTEAPADDPDGEQQRQLERTKRLSKALDLHFSHDEVKLFALQVKNYNEDIYNDDKKCSDYMELQFNYAINNSKNKPHTKRFQNYLAGALRDNYAKYGESTKQGTASTDSSDKFPPADNNEMAHLERVFKLVSAGGDEDMAAKEGEKP
jgi:hypothetical protein